MKRIIKKISIPVFAIIINIFSFVHLAKAEQCTKTNSTILCNPLKTSSFTSLMESISPTGGGDRHSHRRPFHYLFRPEAGDGQRQRGVHKRRQKGLLWANIGSGILIGAWTIMKILQSTVESL